MRTKICMVINSVGTECWHSSFLWCKECACPSALWGQEWGRSAAHLRIDWGCLVAKYGTNLSLQVSSTSIQNWYMFWNDNQKQNSLEYWMTFCLPGYWWYSCKQKKKFPNDCVQPNLCGNIASLWVSCLLHQNQKSIFALTSIWWQKVYKNWHLKHTFTWENNNNVPNYPVFPSFCSSAM